MPRKKSKPEEDGKNSQTDESQGTQSSAAETHVDGSSESSQPMQAPNQDIQQVIEPKGSWYGSWKGKAKPVAEVAKETVVSPVTTPIRIQKKPVLNDTNSIGSPSPKRYLSGAAPQFAKATPLAATTTNLSISSNNTPTQPQPPPPATIPNDTSSTPAVPPPTIPSDAPLPPDPVKPNENKTAPRQVSSGGWFGGWWSRPDGFQDDKKESESDLIQEEAKNVPLPGITPTVTPEQSNVIEEPQSQSQPQPAPESATSWFWSWSKSLDPRSTTPVPPEAEPIKTVSAAELSEQTIKPVSTSHDGKTAKKASAWAFWSKEPENGEDSNKQVGEIAVADTPSQSNPEAAQFNEVEEPKKKQPERRGRTSRSLRPSDLLGLTPQQSPSRKEVDTTTVATSDLLLPQFETTYSLLQKPSIWQNIKDYFIADDSRHTHLHVEPNPVKIKKALAIGVHGFFPPEIFQKVLGPPTGTSIRFANNAAQAIKQWTEAHGYECEIEKVALEGQGLIAERVDSLWKLLLNWIDHVRSADLIMLACHSQGVPVTIMLVERLIKFKCIGPNTRIGICAMAGVNLGPFQEYKTQIFGRSALELFDFSNPLSKVSQTYLGALDTILQHGVKVVYIGSIDDQLVSLESSTFSNVSHPCIYRAVFIDGRLFTSDL
jgi:hypothetical protein